jgi:hypothetical protein
MYMFSQWFIFLLFLHGCINFSVVFCSIFMSVIQYICCVCWCRVIGFDVFYMFFMSYCYGSTWLSNIVLSACVAFYFVYSTWVSIFCFLCQLLIYCIVSFECYTNVCIFKQIGYLSYQWAMVCEYCPIFVLCVSFLFFLHCDLFVLLLGYFFLF